MATDIAIASLPNLPAGSVAGGDILPIVDVSDTTDPGGTTKQTLVSSTWQGQNVHNGILNVQDPAYGAIGNGTTDDTAAIQAAITAASTTGRSVFVPPGRYKISSGFSLPPNVSVLGVPEQTILAPTAALNGVSVIQFTPDMMPSDITGTEILEEDHTTGKRQFQFIHE